MLRSRTADPDLQLGIADNIDDEIGSGNKNYWIVVDRCMDATV
jgi:hypothetical protein